MFKFNLLAAQRSSSDQTNEPESWALERAELLQHIAEVEKELTTYIVRYGLTDEARRLFAKRRP